MAQFDPLIIFSLIWSLLFVLFFHYTILIIKIIPDFFFVKKFRDKKLNFLVFQKFLSINYFVDLYTIYRVTSFN